MKLPLRRIGDSLGVILPQATLEAWGLGEGDSLVLSERGLLPPREEGGTHRHLDDLRYAISLAVLRRRTPQEIRAKILANLKRWEGQGVWVGAYDDWRALALSNDDGALFAAMLGRDENAVRLRQSMPYVGLLSQAELARLRDEPAA